MGKTGEGLKRQSFLLSGLELSELDRRIISHLQEDGRRPYIEIARETGVTEKTIRARARQLLDSDTIRIVALCTPDVLGFSACAMVGVTTLPGSDHRLLSEQLSAISSVDYVTLSHGRYNLLVEILARDDQALRQVLEQEIGSLAGIASVEVFPYHSVSYQQAATALVGSMRPGASVPDRPLSDFDRAVIAILTEDGRMSFRAVAEMTGVSEAKVRQRVQELIALGHIQILALLNPLNLSRVKVAWLAIKAAPGQGLRDLARQLAGNAYISYIAICAGRFDIFAEMICPPDQELLTLIDETIRPMPAIRDIEVFPYSSLHYKRLGAPA